MRDRKKRNIIIGVLCCLLVFMGIGYAILSQTITINGIGNVKGNWDVEITSITLKSQTGRATEVSSSYTNTTASFEADLYMPGDSIEYEVTVENKGNIDAVLQSITPTITNKVADIKFSHSEIDNTPLTAGKTITFTMKVEFLEGTTAIPNVERTGYKLELNYVQFDSNVTSKVVTIVSGDGTGIGDEVTIGTESFYVISSNDINIKLLSKYNLYVGGSFDGTTRTEYGEEATGIQDSTMVGAADSEGNPLLPWKGVTAYSDITQEGTDLTDYENSIVKQYVDNYLIYLVDNLGLNVETTSATLITKEELISLGCDETNETCTTSEYPWIYSTTYWTKTPKTTTTLWNVGSFGTFTDYLYENDRSNGDISVGVRPVVTISKTEL